MPIFVGGASLLAVLANRAVSVIYIYIYIYYLMAVHNPGLIKIRPQSIFVVRATHMLSMVTWTANWRL
ncbi:hypothetical protein IMY05_010G0029300 [Salix suchowensis]|nr:hypothetical protein IMY05_010G0029300 [Salix suchowensis]